MAGSFRKDKTTGAQTALNAAGSITASLVAAGKVTTLPKAIDALEQLFDAGFNRVSPVTDADNALFEQVEASAPAETKSSSGGARGGRSSGKGKGGQKPADAAGTLSMNSGPFKGETIENIFGLDAETAKESFGYTRGTGADYVEYLSSDENPNSYTREAAAAFLEQAA